MRIAVVSLTRDRLDFTRHCFQTLRDHAGCEYDWYVVDQNSQDGTREWLLDQEDLNVTTLSENVGICRGLNLLLDEALNPADYDCIVKFDNDCELLTPNTLCDVAEKSIWLNAVLSPKIHGLRNPPWVYESRDGVDLVQQIGGIFMAVPAALFRDPNGYRHNEMNPYWGGDDVDLCHEWRLRGGMVGYVHGYDANHYLTTDGQEQSDPVYWDRKMREMQLR